MLTWDRFPDSLPDSHDRGKKHDLSYPSLRSNSGDWLDQVDSLPRSPPKYLSPITRSQKQQPADTRHVTANAGPDTQHTTSRGGIAVFGLQMTPPPPPKSRGRALLLGGAITSMQFYSPSRHQQIRSLTSTTTAPDLGVSTEIEPNVEPFAPNGRVGGSPTVASKYVAIGTTEGVAAVLKLDPPPATVASPPPSPVTGRKSSWADLVRGVSMEESAPVGNESDATSGHVVLPGALMHGAVQALEIADIAKNGYDDIVSKCCFFFWITTNSFTLFPYIQTTPPLIYILFLIHKTRLRVSVRIQMPTLPWHGAVASISAPGIVAPADFAVSVSSP